MQAVRIIHHGRHLAKTGAQKKEHPLNSKLPQVLTWKKAQHPRRGILYFGDVRSRSRSTRLVHNVIATKRGNHLRFRCSCESSICAIRNNRSGKPCIHVQSIQRRMRQRKVGR